ncbi:MAG: hypothetical protein WC349_01660 [Patescibacteria group bacterium]|jgi:hypothetical protein
MQSNINNIKAGAKRKIVNDFFSELFYVLSGAILIFTCLEIFWPGIVLAYLNLNYVLIFWLVIGIIILF